MNTKPPDPVLVYITTPDRNEAARIAETVVAEKLAACANFFDGVSSVFRWNGKICHEQECVLILKTTARKSETLTNRICSLHSYECPCVVTLPITGGHRPFLDWVARGE